MTLTESLICVVELQKSFVVSSMNVILKLNYVQDLAYVMQIKVVFIGEV